MPLLRANIWATAVAVVARLNQATAMTIVAILTETRLGTVGTATRTVGMIRTVIPTAVTAGTGGTVAARLRVAGTPLTTGGAGATLGAHPVVAARLVAVTTMPRPPALCRRPTVSLVGKGHPKACATVSWK